MVVDLQYIGASLFSNMTVIYSNFRAIVSDTSNVPQAMILVLILRPSDYPPDPKYHHISTIRFHLRVVGRSRFFGLQDFVDPARGLGVQVHRDLPCHQAWHALPGLPFRWPGPNRRFLIRQPRTLQGDIGW